VGQNSERYLFQSCGVSNVVFSALVLLVGLQEGHLASEKYGGMVEVGTG